MNFFRTAESVAWESRKSIGFFRGSRTNINRDKLILLSREKPDFIDARYTKNQAWRSNAVYVFSTKLIYRSVQTV